MATLTADLVDVDLEQLLEGGERQPCQLVEIPWLLFGWGRERECPNLADWLLYVTPACPHLRAGSVLACDGHVAGLLNGHALLRCEEASCELGSYIRSMERL